jgi:Flp pilus assembly protein TadD
MIGVAAVRAALREGRGPVAVHLGRAAILAVPSADELAYLLAHAWLRVARAEEAHRTIRWAIRLRPDRPELRASLGDILSELGHLDDAASSYRAACSGGLRDARVLANLGQALRRAGDLIKAAGPLRGALILEPAGAEGINRWAPVAAATVTPSAAPRWFRRSGQIAPERADTAGQFGLWCYQAGRLDEARELLLRSLVIRPANAVVVNALGLVELAGGAAHTALPSFRRAVLMRDDLPGAQGNLRLCLSYLPDPGGRAYFAAARRWAEGAYRALGHLRRRHDNVRDPERRLRIGYLSADLREHPVAHNIEGLLAHHDHARYEIHLYADVARPDATSGRLRGMADGWRSIVGLPDAMVAEHVRADRIDVLIAVAGSFAGNRLAVCAGRPAPVQISLYDTGTSGLDTVDLCVTDPTLHPSDDRERYVERLVRVPCWAIHQPPFGAPDVVARPATAPLLLGSFNNPAKIGLEAVALWARVLKALPQAQLVMRYFTRFGTASVVARYVDLFARHGIARERLHVDGRSLDRSAHLTLVSGVDMALDSLPFSGSTATFQALWMGVPVVTRAGDRLVSRLAASQLAAIGLSDLMAESDDGFVDRVVALAEDPGRRAVLRATLRQRLSGSLLCDAPAYARSIEQVYREAWRGWCAAPNA